jgi:cellulose synthase/poly-beta-1,6-N-acetylglucosamine synthase-like glycosyltransferase
MHISPSLIEKDLFTDQGRLSLYCFGAVSTVCLLAGNILFVIYNPGVWPYAIFIALTAFYLSLSYLVGFLGKPFDLTLHNFLCLKWFDRSDEASVDIYLPVCGEDLEIILNTWRHVLNLRLTNNNIKVYVLDDGKNDEVKLQAEKFKFGYIRRETSELKKAGNLRNAFKITSGEFILILDADFCPRQDMLIEMLPYMFEYEKCAIVQSPQFFRVEDHQTWIGKGAAAVQELFYRLMQVNRDTFNGSICVGTCGLYRRKALEPFGGTAPIEYSEDVHTGFQLISTGWRIFYIPIILSAGVCPELLKSFFTQQYRWSLGSMSLFFSKKFWAAPITRMQKLCYMNGQFYYISTGIAALMAPVPGLFMLGFYPDKIHWYNLLLSVPSVLFSTVFMYYWMKLPMGIYVLRSRAVAYFAHLYALKDFLFNSLEEWVPTGVSKASKKYSSFKTLFMVFSICPQFVMLFLLLFRLYEGYGFTNFALVIPFMLFNAAITFPIIKDL